MSCLSIHRFSAFLSILFFLVSFIMEVPLFLSVFRLKYSLDIYQFVFHLLRYFFFQMIYFLFLYFPFNPPYSLPLDNISLIIRSLFLYALHYFYSLVFSRYLWTHSPAFLSPISSCPFFSYANISPLSSLIQNTPLLVFLYLHVDQSCFLF